ncbi:MAG TPA: phosphotransferase [Streptosporangiaceae bacterium]|nr:phosphotransferase [Streptosporangiaceae bacterium]
MPEDHPRLGGWAGLTAGNGVRLRTLPRWVTRHADHLIALERQGLSAAQGTALAHFDALPHNILLTEQGVVLVDWPHARLGAPEIDLLTVLASAAADGLDPDPVLRTQPIAATPGDVDAILAALAGFWLTGTLDERCPTPIAAAKMKLGRGALRWLRCRLGITSNAL